MNDPGAECSALRPGITNRKGSVMRIIHPRPALGRQSALGVEFRDGVAVVESLHPERELALIRHGYTIEPDLEVEAPYHAGMGEPIIDLNSMTIAQLREIAEMDGVELPSKAKHAEIIELLAQRPIHSSTDFGEGS